MNERLFGDGVNFVPVWQIQKPDCKWFQGRKGFKKHKGAGIRERVNQRRGKNLFEQGHLV